MGELVTLLGSVVGTGVYTLDGDLLHSPVAYVRIPAGVKVKVWCKRISGEPADVAIEYSPDVTAPSPAWKAVSVERLASSGELVVEKRRPIVLHGITGREGFRLVRLSGAGSSYVELEVEFEWE